MVPAVCTGCVFRDIDVRVRTIEALHFAPICVALTKLVTSVRAGRQQERGGAEENSKGTTLWPVYVFTIAKFALVGIRVTEISPSQKRVW